MDNASHSVPDVTGRRLNREVAYPRRAAIQPAAETATGEGCRSLLLDDAVTFLAPVTPGILMRPPQSRRLDERRVVLSRPEPRVREMLASGRIHHVIPINGSEGAAKAASLSRAGTA